MAVKLNTVNYYNLLIKNHKCVKKTKTIVFDVIDRIKKI